MKDQESFDKLPSVPGVLTFREDYDKLYVNKKNGWDPVVTREEVRIYCIFNCDICEAGFHSTNLFARRETNTKIQRCNWLAKKFVFC